MARKSKVEGNKKRMAMVKKYRAKRTELKKLVVDPNLSPEDKGEAMRALQALPRDASPIRVRNRCILTGRSRGYLRAFGLSRIQFRELAHQGMVPGVTKSSW